MTNRDELQREPEPVVITTALGHQRPVLVVEEDEPIQHAAWRRMPGR
jgi:hypothetical protein